MKKIPTIFLRDFEGNNPSLVTKIPNPECDWVFRGEGIATLKHDGTSCLVLSVADCDTKFWKRQEVKKGKPMPADFMAAQEADPITGKWVGWVPVTDGPEDSRHREAWANYVKDHGGEPPEGTYELCGPKVQGNPELLDTHQLIRHGTVAIPEHRKSDTRTYRCIRDYLCAHTIEGIVYHHPDGRMAKIKSRDCGLPWPPQP